VHEQNERSREYEQKRLCGTDQTGYICHIHLRHLCNGAYCAFAHPLVLRLQRAEPRRNKDTVSPVDCRRRNSYRTRIRHYLFRRHACFLSCVHANHPYSITGAPIHADAYTICWRTATDVAVD